MPDPFTRFDVVVASSVLSFLPGDTALVRCAELSRRWRAAATDEILWRHVCLNELRILEKPELNGEIVLSWRETYREVVRRFYSLGKRTGLQVQKINVPQFLRVHALWETIENWARAHSPSILASLNPGATAHDFAQAEKTLQVPLPDLHRMIFGYHNGQPEREALTLGLLGGCSFYDYFASSRLLPVGEQARQTVRLRQRLAQAGLDPTHTLLIAGDPTRMPKVIFTNLRNMDVLVDGLLAHPKDVGGEGLLRWLEEFASRLKAGVYSCSHIIPEEPESVGLNLFPQAGGEVTEAVTKGVLVRASALFVPRSASKFAYSIRMRLVSEEQLGYPSCQLLRRKWRITDGNGNVNEVEGEGVIGMYPILTSAGFEIKGEMRPGEFVYQSCSGPLPDIPPNTGYFGGFFTFVPGTRKKPLGPEFEVEVRPFPLRVPEWLY